jgi:hypothetical protein
MGDIYPDISAEAAEQLVQFVEQTGDGYVIGILGRVGSDAYFRLCETGEFLLKAIMSPEGDVQEVYVDRDKVVEEVAEGPEIRLLHASETPQKAWGRPD